MEIFASNCPQFFHPAERTDYEAFLSDPGAYFVCRVDERIVGAFGLEREAPERARLRWILLERERQGSGLGKHIMRAACSIARDDGVVLIDIAASHKSAPFFERFGAREIARRENGWGSGMHRVDLELVL